MRHAMPSEMVTPVSGTPSTLSYTRLGSHRRPPAEIHLKLAKDLLPLLKQNPTNMHRTNPVCQRMVSKCLDFWPRGLRRTLKRAQN